MPRMIFFLISFFFKFMSFLHFSSSKHGGTSGFPQPSPSAWQEKKPIWGFLAHVLQWEPISHHLLKLSSAVPAVTRETLGHRTGQTEGEQGRREITCLVSQTKWTSWQCQSLSKRSQCLVLPRQGSATRLRLTPELSDASLLLQQLWESPAVNPRVCSDFKPGKICSRGRGEFPRHNSWRMDVQKLPTSLPTLFFSSFFKHW